MNPGKVSNSILKRSVLKQIKKREEYAAKPAIGVDCAYISRKERQACGGECSSGCNGGHCSEKSGTASRQ